jgi:hypothetical protein
MRPRLERYFEFGRVGTKSTGPPPPMPPTERGGRNVQSRYSLEMTAGHAASAAGISQAAVSPSWIMLIPAARVLGRGATAP